MFSVVLLFFVIAFALVITKIAASALVLTGMSRDAARFQARSAFCGVGFTTGESEFITQHPVRRRIVMLLMLLGNAGIATMIATVIVSLSDREEGGWTSSVMAIVVGIIVLSILGNSRIIDGFSTRIIEWALRRFTDLEVKDYTALLQLSEGYTVVEVVVCQGDWLEGHTLASLALPKEGVLILGIRRSDGVYVGAPTGTMQILDGDTLALYGKLERIDELNKRRGGIVGVYAHQVAVKEHKQEVHREARIDKQHGPQQACNPKNTDDLDE